jgi:hypothetical protein
MEAYGLQSEREKPLVGVHCCMCGRSDAFRSVVDAKSAGWLGFSRLIEGLTGECPDCTRIILPKTPNAASGDGA